jgi:predicted DNA-binding WGR domain protein
MARLFCTEDGANKFWEGTVEDATLIVRFGKVGTAGQEKKKTLASAAAAEAELAKVTAEKKRKGYREGPGDPAAPPPAHAPYPFRFYGRRPADWFEGPHALEIRVESDPAPAAKVLAEQLGRNGLPQNAAVASAPGVMRLDLVDPDRSERFFDAVEHLLREIHRVVPIREVVLLSQRAPGKHAWDVWSREQGAPAPGPVYADWKKPVAGEVRDPSLPVPKRDATLEHAVTAAQDAAQGAKEAASAAKAVATGQPAAVLVPGKVAPKPPDAVEAVGRASWSEGADGTWVGVASFIDEAARAAGEPPWEFSRVWVKGASGAMRELPKIASWPGRHMVEGGRMLMVARWGTYGSVIAVDLASGETTTLYEQGFHEGASSINRLVSVTRGPGGELVCGSIDHLILVSPDGTDAHFVKADATQLGRAGQTLLVTKGKTTLLYRIEKGKLKRAGDIKAELWPVTAWQEDGHWYVMGPQNKTYELTGV